MFYVRTGIFIVAILLSTLNNKVNIRIIFEKLSYSIIEICFMHALEYTSNEYVQHTIIYIRLKRHPSVTRLIIMYAQ